MAATSTNESRSVDDDWISEAALQNSDRSESTKDGHKFAYKKFVEFGRTPIVAHGLGFDIKWNPKLRKGYCLSGDGGPPSAYGYRGGYEPARGPYGGEYQRGYGGYHSVRGARGGYGPGPGYHSARGGRGGYGAAYRQPPGYGQGGYRWGYQNHNGFCRISTKALSTVLICLLFNITLLCFRFVVLRYCCSSR
eukprot:708457_1